MYRTLSAAVFVTVLMFVPTMAQSNSITISASAPTLSGFNEVRSIHVSLADVDLASAQGAATAFSRIDVAARAVCGGRVGVQMNAARAKLFETCRVRAVRYAVQQVDAPELTRLAAVH